MALHSIRTTAFVPTQENAMPLGLPTHLASLPAKSTTSVCAFQFTSISPIRTLTPSKRENVSPKQIQVPSAAPQTTLSALPFAHRTSTSSPLSSQPKPSQVRHTTLHAATTFKKKLSLMWQCSACTLAAARERTVAQRHKTQRTCRMPMSPLRARGCMVP